jgi:PIN domain nuclease of toxin-antitoxin system
VRLLLDTHAFLWWITDDPHLSDRARALIGGGENEVFLSAASAWELAVKAALRRVELAQPLDRFVPDQLERNGFQALPVSVRHALALPALPPLHRDPFDRMLVAQALTEEMTLVSADREIWRYPVPVAW